MVSRMSSPAFSRRDFLATASLATAAALAGCATGARPAGGIIDTHTHFYDPTRPQGVPWPPPGDTTLYRPVLPAEYKALAQPLGVTGTVVVEASPWLEDNQWVLDLAERDPFIVGFVGNLTPGQPEFAAQLKRFARHPLFRGIRIGGDTIEQALRDRPTMDDLRRLAEHDLSLDVLLSPDQLPVVEAFSDALREIRIVVDHVANVPIRPLPHPNRWVSGLVGCHYSPNVVMKISGLVEGSGRRGGQAPVDLEFYRPVLDAVWRIFGEDRLLYASNWPVSTLFADYATVQRLALDYFAAKGSKAVTKVFHANAARTYRIVRG